MIPVFINVFNRLTTTKNLAEQVAQLEGAVPILIDNASTYPPLLNWYNSCEFEVVRLNYNGGHHSPWNNVILQDPNEFEQQYGTSYYVVTDCDLDITECPSDLLSVLLETFEWETPPIKAGISLRIDDLPEWQSSVVQWESRWWKTPLKGGRFFKALIDTTFALYSCHTPHKIATTVVGVDSVRTAPPYVAKHIPWYLDGNNLDIENTHYFSTANNSNSWKPVGRGLKAPYANQPPS